jgi:hypothetical protein
MVTPPARPYNETISVTCDICGTVHKGAQEDGEGVNWGNSHDDIDSTGVYMKKGYNCPSGGSQDTEQYHVCPSCMREHVIPFVASLTKNPMSKYDVNW